MTPLKAPSNLSDSTRILLADTNEVLLSLEQLEYHLREEGIEDPQIHEFIKNEKKILYAVVYKLSPEFFNQLYKKPLTQKDKKELEGALNAGFANVLRTSYLNNRLVFDLSIIGKIYRDLKLPEVSKYEQGFHDRLDSDSKQESSCNESDEVGTDTNLSNRFSSAVAAATAIKKRVGKFFRREKSVAKPNPNQDPLAADSEVESVGEETSLSSSLSREEVDWCTAFTPTPLRNDIQISPLQGLEDSAVVPPIRRRDMPSHPILVPNAGRGK